MSHSFIDRSSNYFTQNYENDEPQKNIDPIAQLQELEDTTVRDWGLFNNPDNSILQKKVIEENTTKESDTKGKQKSNPDY